MSRFIRPVTVIVATVVSAAVVTGCGAGGSTASPPASPASSASSAGPASSADPASPSSSGSGAGPAPASSSAPAPADVTVCTLPLVACAGEMRSEPASITLSADGSGIVDHLSWSGWGSPTAQGTGTLEINNCNPTCVGGTFHGYPATVTLTTLTPYGSGGTQAYADMTVSAPTSAYGTNSYHHLLP